MPHRKDWKAITIDWTALADYDHLETLGVCLTQRQVAVLKACLMPAYWSTRWENLTATADELDEFVATIDNQLSGNDCGVIGMEFRDNPADPCEVQYSHDGVIWTTMFRKDVCTPAPTAADIDNIYTDITNITINNTTWAGDIVNVAPEWEWDDADSDKALCWAINFYVDAICETMVSEKMAENDDRRLSDDFLDSLTRTLGSAVVSAIAFFVATPITMPMVAMTAFAWAVTVIADDIWDFLVAIDFSDFQDEDARTAISCVMFQSMEGATPQHGDWQDSLEHWATFSGAYKSIAGAVHIINQSADTYINFLLLVEDINTIASGLPVCPCPATWSHTWDFENVGREGWTIGAFGEYQVGVGIVGTLRLLGGFYSMIILDLLLDEVVPRCDGFSFFSKRVRGTWDSNVDSLHMKQPPQPDHTQNSGWFLTGETSWRHNFALGDLTSAEIQFIRSCFTAAGSYGSVIITTITLHGQGVDPFLGWETS